ncbi:hypothetical protein OSR40_013065 [Serratia rubidaea]|nr:hypothetical protein [Serratia rubidaea]MDK1704664.1 hypothetical protein [Serratia rubidaea]
MATPNRNIAPGYCIAQQPGSLTYHAHTLFGGYVADTTADLIFGE